MDRDLLIIMAEEYLSMWDANKEDEGAPWHDVLLASLAASLLAIAKNQVQPEMEE